MTLLPVLVLVAESNDRKIQYWKENQRVSKKHICKNRPTFFPSCINKYNIFDAIFAKYRRLFGAIFQQKYVNANSPTY